jgi:O-antigen ligase
LALLVVLLPLFFFPNLIDLYRLPKETLLAFLTAVVSWLWLLNSMRQGDNERPILPLLLPVSLYLLITGLSLINALNPYGGSRHFLNLLVGITLFWIAVNHIDRVAVPALFRCIAIAGAIVSFVGIVQAWGVEIPRLFQVSPPSSTFGNKNMAAQYILFVLPIAFYLLLSASQRFPERCYAGLAAIISTYLVYTWTRAAWGGAAVSLLILWFCLRARGFTPEELLCLSKRKWALLGGIGLFVLSMNLLPAYFLTVWRPGWKAVSSTPIEHLGNILELERGASARTRFAIWANTLAIFKDNPFLGVGKGNFQFIYPLYNRNVVKDPSFSAEMKAAEAHNDYVQLLAEVGILGSAAFVLILVLVARRYWRSLKEKVDPSILAVGFALIAILLDAFWDFPFANPTPTAFFWIYAGLLWRLTQENSIETARAIPRGVASGIIAIFALSATLASILSFMHSRAEFYHSRGLFGRYQVETLEEKLDRTEEDFNQAIQLYPYDYRYHFWMAVLKMRQGKGPGALQANLRALSLHPYHINTLNNLGVIYVALGNIPKAIQAYEIALRIWPDYVDVRNNLGQIYEKTGAKEKAIEEFGKTLRIDPKNKLASEKLAALRNKK